MEAVLLKATILMAGATGFILMSDVSGKGIVKAIKMIFTAKAPTDTKGKHTVVK